MEEYPIDEIMESIDFSKNQYQTLKSGIMLTNWEISVLEQYHVPYQKCLSLKEILYEIEEVLQDQDDCLELENVSSSISERDYYQNTPF